MRKYEGHITFSAEYAHLVQEYAVPDNGWHYSCIADDPVLGDGHRCYLTGYDDDSDTLIKRMVIVSMEIKVPFLRMKVEETIFDTEGS
jgi:hypothetical protein